MRYARVSVPLLGRCKWNLNLSRKFVAFLANSNEWINNIDGNNYAQLPKNSFNKIPRLIMLVGFNKIQHISNEICMTWTTTDVKKAAEKEEWKQKTEQCARTVAHRCIDCLCDAMCVCAFKWFFPVCNHFYTCRVCWLLQHVTVHWVCEWYRAKCQMQAERKRECGWKQKTGTKVRARQWEKINDTPSNN